MYLGEQIVFTDDIYTEIEIVRGNNFLSNSRIGGIFRVAIRMVPMLIENIQQMTMNFLRLIRRSSIAYLTDFLSFLASSENTNVIYKRANSYKNCEGNSQRNGGFMLASMLSKVFMMPFKIIFGSLRRLPVSSIYEYLISTIPFIDIISENCMVQSMSNATFSMTETMIDYAWNFTKANILPWMDKTITNLHKSNTLPNSIMEYLEQLQSFYHICHYLGIL
jgi:hypothetical protein